MTGRPIDENAVVEAVCVRLKREGHSIIRRANTTQRGIDVEAIHITSRQIVLVEAKGATSARPSSARYGSTYNGNQVFDRVAKGVYTVLKIKQDNPWARVILALPDQRDFRKRANGVASRLEAVAIEIWYL